MPAVPMEAYDRLRDEKRQLEVRLAESEAENDQWQKKVAELWADIERLRTGKEHWQDVAARLNSENERLTLEAMRWATENEQLRRETGRG